MGMNKLEARFNTEVDCDVDSYFESEDFVTEKMTINLTAKGGQARSKMASIRTFINCILDLEDESCDKLNSLLLETIREIFEKIENPLIIAEAARLGDLEEVKRLVKIGFAIDEFAVWGAAENGHMEVVKYLIENGAHYDEHAVHAAATSYNLKIVKYLVKIGAPIAEWTVHADCYFLNSCLHDFLKKHYLEQLKGGHSV